MIGFAVAGDDRQSTVSQTLREMSSKPVQRGAIEYAAPILGDTDQMHGKKCETLCRPRRNCLHVPLQTNHNGAMILHIQVP